MIGLCVQCGPVFGERCEWCFVILGTSIVEVGLFDELEACEVMTILGALQLREMRRLAVELER